MVERSLSMREVPGSIPGFSNFFPIFFKTNSYFFQVFTSVALFNVLISPLNAFPWVINGLMEAWVSVKRVQQFLQMEEIDWDHYYCIDCGHSHTSGTYVVNIPLSLLKLKKFAVFHHLRKLFHEYKRQGYTISFFLQSV